ncbi:PREDICTED: interleukin-6 receptor subunit alpha-like isoform X1 [Cyprinodon variegatus]|uniref:Interleukin 6 receptor n=2 Tax=Cyprinodon variegatus TaxID=28743 RepID=A0A3Q2FDB2_CYPVA|nr:PREDICTED: interleukin-6 receptor subunit alpha-like isoform X1 [Cyprinodon variegatus]
MGNLLRLLGFLCIMPVSGNFDGICPRKEPPPGVLVVPPGSSLELNCDGHVRVNGDKVSLSRKVLSTNKRRSPSERTPITLQVRRNTISPNRSKKTSAESVQYHSTTTAAGVNTVQGENQSNEYSNKERFTSPQVVQPTPLSMTTILRGESKWEENKKKPEDEYRDKDWGESSRVTRGAKIRPQWRWNKQLVQRADRDWGEMEFLNGGSSLSLSSVRQTDAGKYTCHQRGEETLAVTVIVADPPETPTMLCYMKSPWSKIRCESKPLNSMIKYTPDCSLFLSTRDLPQTKIEDFQQIPCSYSSRRSRCWCALENNDEGRTTHTAFLCVTNILGNATSPPIYFTPLDILKPNPPSKVTAHLVEKVERMIKVTWNLPESWNQPKYPDEYYDIIYEIRYRPLISSHEQKNDIKERHYTITDALPGTDYLIQLRSKEEYDGHWSEWTTPIIARSWTANVEEEGQPMTTMDVLPSIEDLGSGFPEEMYLDGTTHEICINLCQTQYHVLWISATLAITSVILAVYILRHKDRFMSKLHRLTITHSDHVSPPPPSIPSTPERENLMSGSDSQLYKQLPSSETQDKEENEEEQTEMDRVEAMNFNNKSYFFLEIER